MKAIYFGNCTIWGKGAGSGSWVMGDLENGLWAGNVSPHNNTPANSPFVTAMLKGDAAGKNAADDAVQANIVSVDGP